MGKGSVQVIVQLRLAFPGLSTAGWRYGQAEGLCDITFSVVTFLSICVVDQCGELGGTLPNTLMLLEGKAVGIVLAGNFLVSDNLVNMITTAWRSGLNGAAGLRWQAIPTSLISKNLASSSFACDAAAFFAGHARAADTPSSTASCHTACHSESSGDWRARISGAASGIPPAQN